MNPTRIQLRYDTIQTWQSSGGKLNIGELGIAQKPDGSVEARVGTENNQLWENAKPLSVSQDQLGLNIEEVGRVFLLLNLGEYTDLTFFPSLSTPCILSSTVEWAQNSTSEIWPKQSFPVGGFCTQLGSSQIVQNVNFVPFRVVARGNNLVGYQSEITNVEQIVGFVHREFGNQFNCSSLSTPLGTFSESHPIRPLASDGAKLVWLKNVEMWTYTLDGTNPYISFVTLVDGWFPDSYLSFECNSCTYGNCFCAGSGWYCTCSNDRCPCPGELFQCPVGTSPLTLEEIINNTDFDPIDYNVVDYFYYGTDQDILFVRIPYYLPKEIKIQGYTFDKSVPTFDRTTKNWVNKYGVIFDEIEEGIVYWDIQDNEWKITNTLEGGIY